jgi:hypothetical protein
MIEEHQSALQKMCLAEIYTLADGCGIGKGRAKVVTCAAELVMLASCAGGEAAEDAWEEAERTWEATEEMYERASSCPGPNHPASLPCLFQSPKPSLRSAADDATEAVGVSAGASAAPSQSAAATSTVAAPEETRKVKARKGGKSAKGSKGKKRSLVQVRVSSQDDGNNRPQTRANGNEGRGKGHQARGNGHGKGKGPQARGNERKGKGAARGKSHNERGNAHKQHGKGGKRR